MTAKTGQSRQAEFKARQAKAGLVRVEVWIPSDKKADVLAYIKGLKK